MATDFEHTSHFGKPVDAVRAALASEAYWKDRMAAIGGPGAELSSVDDSNGTVTVTAVQTVAADKLPSVVTKIRPGDLAIHRKESIGPLSDGRATGEFEATIDGAPASITGTKTVEADGAGTVVRVKGEIEVRIPLVGGKIEGVVAGQLSRLFEVEDGFTEQWLDGRE